MDTTEQIRKLEERVKILERAYASLKSASEIDPEIIRAISFKLGLTSIATSSDVVTDYDRAVNESGSSSYTVAKVYDGLFLINGKIVGFYNDV